MKRTWVITIWLFQVMPAHAGMFDSIMETSDLNQYVTDEALSGLFLMMGKEETKIRTDPAARATDLLKKVFAGQ